MTDFNILKRNMLACTLCPNLPLGPKPIFQLNPEVKILIAGQAPGRITHGKNVPFDDPSGDRLRRWLGVDRTIFYDDPRIGIFPMGLCFPGTGANGDLPPTKVCADTWRARAMKHLDQVQLTLVLGAYAIDWHIPQLSNVRVTDAVKATSDGADGLFCLPHPSPRNNRWLRRNPWFEDRVVPRIQARVLDLLAADA